MSNIHKIFVNAQPMQSQPQRVVFQQSQPPNVFLNPTSQNMVSGNLIHPNLILQNYIPQNYVQQPQNMVTQIVPQNVVQPNVAQNVIPQNVIPHTFFPQQILQNVVPQNVVPQNVSFRQINPPTYQNIAPQQGIIYQPQPQRRSSLLSPPLANLTMK